MSWWKRGKVEPEPHCRHRAGQQKTSSADRTLLDCHRLAPARTATVALLRLGVTCTPAPPPLETSWPAASQHRGFPATAEWARPPAKEMNWESQFWGKRAHSGQGRRRGNSRKKEIGKKTLLCKRFRKKKKKSLKEIPGELWRRRKSTDTPDEPERQPESRKRLTRMETEILQNRGDVMPELQRFPKQLQTPAPGERARSTGEVEMRQVSALGES